MFDLTNELNTLYYRKATSMDSSGNRVYTSTSIANGSLDGKRITLTWSPASNGVYFKVYVDSSLKTSFTLTGISLNNPYLFIGNDCDVSFEYSVPLAIKDLVLVNYAISSYSVITNALKNIRVNSLLDRYGRFVESKYINTNGTTICTHSFGYDKYNGISNNYVSSSSYKLANNELHSFDYCFEKGETPTPLVQYIDYTKPDGSVVRTTYVYDGNNRLTEETTGSTTKTYAYDNLGNMTTNRGVTMNYDDKKRLRSYGNLLLKYDSVNPYKLIKKGTFSNEIQQTGQEFTYCGNQIVSIRDVASNTTYNYEYDYLGRRTSKTNGTTTKTYHYLGDKLIAEISNTYDLRFMYDEFDKLFGFYYNDIPYFYLRNALGTIYGIIDQNGSLVVKYEYDAWGKLLTTTRSNDTNNIASINPFIYKAYYYDVETGLFWLSSRYYSPELCRFISPDDVGYLDPSSINGLNLYSYCGNDPVMCRLGYNLGGVISAPISNIGSISSNISSRNRSSSPRSRSRVSASTTPFANVVSMTNYSTTLVDNILIGMALGNISHTTTIQHNNSGVFYAYSNIGNSTSSVGVGLNIKDWYGLNAYVSSNIGIGSSMQLGSITYGAKVSVLDGVSFSFGTVTGNVTNETTVSIGWGTLAFAYAACGAIAVTPFPMARAVAAVAVCVVVLIDIFN